MSTAWLAIAALLFGSRKEIGAPGDYVPEPPTYIPEPGPGLVELGPEPEPEPYYPPLPPAPEPPAPEIVEIMVEQDIAFYERIETVSPHVQAVARPPSEGLLQQLAGGAPEAYPVYKPIIREVQEKVIEIAQATPEEPMTGGGQRKPVGVYMI